MSKGAPKIPPAPDPYATAQSQSLLNQQAAELTGQMNRIGTISPFGSTTYEYAPGYDPAASQGQASQVPFKDFLMSHPGVNEPARNVLRRGGSIQDAVPSEVLTRLQAEHAGQGQGGAAPASRYIQRTTFSPEVQALVDAQMRNQTGLSNLAATEQARIAGQAPLSFEGLPQLRTGLNLEGLPNLSELDLPELPGSGGYEQSRGRVEEAIMSRLQPQFDRDSKALEARMAEQGIPMGSEAYSSGFGDLNRALVDARMQAVLAGGQEQSRLAGLDMAARGQLFGEGMETRRQGISEQQLSAALAQAARQQGVSERTALHQIPYQNLAQFMGLGQTPQLPQQPGMPQVQIAPGDFQGAANQAYNAQTQGALQASQNKQALSGDIAGLAGTLAMAAMLSDERVKEDIEPYGGGSGLSEIMSLDPVQFRYKSETGIDPGQRHGFLAQDVAQTMPEAVVQNGEGPMAIDYMKLIPELVAAMQQQQRQIQGLRRA